MKPRVHTSFAAAAAALAVLASAAHAAGAKTAAPSGLAGRWTAEKAAIDDRNSRLEQRARAFKPSHSWSLGGKSVGARQVAGDGGHLVVRVHRRPDKVVRANRTLQLLASQLGDALMVPPAVVLGVNEAGFQASSKGDVDVMVMKHIGNPYESGHKASSSWLKAINEETRINGAVIDLLTQQRDRKMANLLVDKAGTVRLIDPDRVFKPKTDHSSYRSQFFPGGKVGYKSRQETLADLPPKAQQLVKDLAAAKLAEIKEYYGVNDDEAEVMQKQAKAIEKLGLSGAVEAFVRTLTLKYDWR